MKNFNPVSEDNPHKDFEYPQTMHPVIFNSNKERLIGTFFRAAGKEKKPLVFLLHGFPGNENNFDIAHAVSRFGWNAVIFHYRGSWGSSGSFSFSNSLDDLYFAIDYFSNDEIAERYNIDREKIILIGHSMGGMLVLLASIKYPQIKNVASLAGFNFGLFTDYVLTHPEFKDATMDGLAQGAELLQNTDADALFNEMIERKDEWNLVKRAKELSDKNILLIAAEYDNVAPLELHYHPLVATFTKIGINFKSKILQSGHSFTSMRISLTTEIINWLEKIITN